MAVAALSLAACSKNEFKVYETAAPSLYFTASGFIDITSEWDSEDAYRLWVYRSGNTEYWVDVVVRLMPGALTSYNRQHGVDYPLLPEGCYSLPSSETTVEGDLHLVCFDVGFDRAAISRLPRGRYVLPLGLKSDRANITKDKKSVLLSIDVKR